MEVLYRRNFAFIYDVCQVIMCKVAKQEDWMDLFILNGQEQLDMQTTTQLLTQFDQVDDALLLFGYRDSKQGTLISHIYFLYLKESTEACEIDDFIQYISDIERVRQITARFYLNEQADDHILERIGSLKRFPGDIKSQLYEFFLFTENYMTTVIREIQKVIEKMKIFYSNHLEALIQNQETFDYTDLKNAPLIQNWDRNQKQGICYTSFSLFSRYVIIRGQNPHYSWLILGCDYEKSLWETNQSTISIAKFGNAIGDKLRVKIIEEIAANGEMTLTDLSVKLGVASTIITYHLDILKTERLLLHRNQGRKVLYWLNVNRFEDALITVKKLYGGAVK